MDRKGEFEDVTDPRAMCPAAEELAPPVEPRPYAQAADRVLPLCKSGTELAYPLKLGASTPILRAFDPDSSERRRGKVRAIDLPEGG
jgi:hypothetical protein